MQKEKQFNKIFSVRVVFYIYWNIAQQLKKNHIGNYFLSIIKI